MASNVSELINQGISKEIVVQLNCPECGGIQLVRDMKMGEIVCCGCGLVIREDYVYSGPEYITFTPEEMKSRVRVGSPTSYHRFDKGLSTVIRVERDAFGRPLSHACKSLESPVKSKA